MSYRGLTHKLDSGYIIHISGGNSKMGYMPNFNLLPGETCSADACRTCYIDGCYAREACEKYSTNRAGVACKDNTLAIRHDLEGVENALTKYFSGLNAPRFFRIHESGDFDSVDYGRMWCRIARKFPDTHFLAFTKQYGIVRAFADEIPENLQIVLSAWRGITIPDDMRSRFPVAWCDDGGDDYSGGIMRDLRKSALCQSGCDHCGLCWQLSYRGCDVTFFKH